MIKSYYAILIIFLFISACNNSSVELESKDLLLYQKSMTINDVPAASVTFFGVSDSRCPKDVQCVWAGNATVDLLLKSVTTEGAVSEHIVMCYGDCSVISSRKIGVFQPDTLNHTFAGVNYQFILEEVNNEVPSDRKEGFYNYGLKLKVLKK